jgi:hypothetical protein
VGDHEILTLRHPRPLTPGAGGVTLAAMAAETFNPWTVVNLVFNHLAEHGLHPVLGEAGDPAGPASDLLRAFGIEPGRNDETVASARVQESLEEIRERMLGAPPT